MNKNLWSVLLFLLCCSVFTSCIQDKYYTTDPDTSANTTTTPTNYRNVYNEQFNEADKNGWTFTSSDDSAYSSTINGYLEYINYGSTFSTFTTIGIETDILNNFAVEARIRCNNTMGLVFGASGTNNGYVLYMDGNGYYALYREGYGKISSTEIIPFTLATPYVVARGWNTVELVQTGNRWKGYINGSQMFSITAQTLAGNKFGFKVLPGTIGYADYIKVTTY